ncbi:HRDC domain-containing protein [Flavobacterium sp. TSSA_36]|uniref:HRDC domain-containing protein n=1 Tax=Flavobacterium sp. TSSA_36 TaxID=3447669 RepID=UPI003F2B4588
MNVQVFSVRVDAPHLAQDQQQLNDFIASVELVQSDTHFIESDASYWSVLLHYKEKINLAAREKESLTDLTTEQIEKYQQLKKWRNALANQRDVKPFMICHNSHLIQIAVQHPKTSSDFQWIKGFGTKRTQQYADQIIQLLENIYLYQEELI